MKDLLKNKKDESLRIDVQELGALLGQIIRRHSGLDAYELVERVRRLSTGARHGDNKASAELHELLSSLSPGRAHLLARAFSQFLGQVNIAERHHRIRRTRELSLEGKSAQRPASIRATLAELIELGHLPESLHHALSQTQVEFVLTAHPTQATRRTILQKQERIANILAERDRVDRTARERRDLDRSLQAELLAWWSSDERRQHRPTPVDEARTGFVLVEEVLWHSLPRFLRRLDDALIDLLGEGLNHEAAPIRFSSWMGGDRDGNPKVTAAVSFEVAVRARWMSAQIFRKEVDLLRAELSMRQCTLELRSALEDPTAWEPYRNLLKGLSLRLEATERWWRKIFDKAVNEGALLWQGDRSRRLEPGVIQNDAELLEPLLLCWRSLNDLGYGAIARGRLLDLIRRVRAFGLALLRLDLRQDAAVHREAMSALTEHFGLGRYEDWSEAEKVSFLEQELANKRPLIPCQDMPDSPELRELYDTLRVAAWLPEGSLGAYIISMAKNVSDVLLVEVFQREIGVNPSLRVVPLFETLDDLDQSAATLQSLLEVEAYRHQLRNVHHGRQAGHARIF